MPTPASGTISIYDVNKEFGLGNDLGAYRGVKWYTPGTLISGFFATTNLSLTDFYNKQKNDPVVPSPTGGVDVTSTFVVPLFRNTLTIKIWGAGGAGGALSTCGNYVGGSGGNTAVSCGSIFSMVAYGGTYGGNAQRISGSYFGFSGNTYGSGGSGGGASGGTTNSSGGGGSASTGYPYSVGGASPNNGQTYGSVPTANGQGGYGYFPGGGGGGQSFPAGGGKFYSAAGGGGGGGYSERTFTNVQLPPGSVLSVSVGKGGTYGLAIQPTQGNPCGNGNGSSYYWGGSGADGRCLITYS
jgi:hypothetical protein